MFNDENDDRILNSNDNRPVALFDHSLATVVVSPMDNFKVSVLKTNELSI